MGNILSFAKRELDILAKITPESVILPFRKEILSICEAFEKSEQSGGSAPFTAMNIASVIKNLCMQIPISEVLGEESEWVKVTNNIYQNNRCSALFKDNNKSYYLDAIVWVGKDKYDMFTGSVYLDNKDFKKIYSRQYVKFPFVPKTFYVNIDYIPITEEETKERNIDYYKDNEGNCYYAVVKNPKQLDEVFKYYDLKD